MLSAPAPARAAEGAVTAPARGVVVVALGEGASEAARPLAHEVYRDAALRPAIDDATARVLCGEPAAVTASAALRELGELRRSIPPAGPDAATRRLLGALGDDLHARLVVSVVSVDGKPVARVLRVAGASFEPVTLSAATQPSVGGGEGAIVWPGAVASLRLLLALPAPAPFAPAAEPTPVAPPPAAVAPAASGKAAFWKSPWFWAPIGVLLTAGVTVLVVSQTTDTASGSVHLQGRVAP